MSNIRCKCPKCEFTVYDVYDLDVMAAHMWEEHRIPVEFNVNGERIRSGPENPLLRAFWNAVYHIDVDAFLSTFWNR